MQSNLIDLTWILYLTPDLLFSILIVINRNLVKPTLTAFLHMVFYYSTSRFHLFEFCSRIINQIIIFQMTKRKLSIISMSHCIIMFFSTYTHEFTHVLPCSIADQKLFMLTLLRYTSS